MLEFPQTLLQMRQLLWRALQNSVFRSCFDRAKFLATALEATVPTGLLLFPNSWQISIKKNPYEEVIHN